MCRRSPVREARCARWRGVLMGSSLLVAASMEAFGCGHPSCESLMPLCRCLQGHTNWVTGLAFSPDGTQMASVSYDGTVKVWDMANPDNFQTFLEHTDRVIRVAWSPDGRTLASCGYDKTIWFWNVKEGKARTVLYGHSGAIFTLAFTPDSRRLVSGSEDGTVRVWGRRKRRVSEHYQWLCGLSPRYRLESQLHATG